MIRAFVTCAGVGALFAACGCGSSAMYADKGNMTMFVGVPFAVLCATLLARNRKPLLIVVMLSSLWPLSRFLAVSVDLATGNGALAMGLAGLIGGLGVATVLGLADRRLLSFWLLGGAALTGCLAGLSFCPWLVSHNAHLNTMPDPLQPARLCLAFGVWQFAVGTYVYASAKRIIPL